MKLLLRSRGRMRKQSLLLRLGAMLSISVAIAGCAGTNLPASVAGGECRVFERPEYVVKGARRYDQNWIDGNIEAGVGACGWKRPAARPASVDATDTIPPPPAPQVSRARRVMNALRHPIKSYKAHRAAKKAGSVAPAPVPVARPVPPPAVPTVPPPALHTPTTFDPPAPAPVVPTPTKKRNAIDELLDPQ
jgi:hypothetical protein